MALLVKGAISPGIKVASPGGNRTEYNTIAAALAAAVAGDVIEIFPGTYAESNLTLKAGVNLLGTDPDQCIIEANDGANPILNAGVTCSISKLKISNTNVGAPAIRATNNTLTLRNCVISGNVAGSAVQLTGGNVDFYQSVVLAGTVDLSTGASGIWAEGSSFHDDITTADALAHTVTLILCSLNNHDILSAATGNTRFEILGCTEVHRVRNDGTGPFIIYGSAVSIVQTTSTGTMRIYGGYIETCTGAVGLLVWYVAGSSLKVLPNMKIQHGIDEVVERMYISPGTYAESGLWLEGDLIGLGTPEECIISKNDAANYIVRASATHRISNLTIANQNAGAPGLRVTGGTSTLRNCIINGAGAGDAIQMTGGALNIYDSDIGVGDIDLSSGVCILRMFYCRLTTDPIDTAGASAHAITLEHCDLGGQNVNSAATGAATLALRGCTNVGTVGNLGTGTFTIENSTLIGVTVNNASAIIRLRNCDYWVVTRTAGSIVDESMALIDGLFHVLHKVWEVLTAAVYNSRTGGAGAVTLGGAGQVRLRITNAAADIAGLESAADVAGSLESSFTPARTPRYVQQISVSAFGAGANGNRQFYGLRATLGGAIPAAEQHAGFIWDGTNFKASSYDGGVAQTTNLTTPSTGAQHTLEVIIFAAVKVEFRVDGVLVATHTTRIPSALLDWQELIHGIGTGASSAGDVTLRRGRIQECPN